MNESRKEFESWATENRNAYFPDFTRANDKKDNYYGIATQAAWEAWQAAREKPIKLPVDKPDYPGNTPHAVSVNDIKDGYNLALWRAKQAIEAAGYRYE